MASIDSPDIQVMAALHYKFETHPYRCFREKGQNAINFIHFITPVQILFDETPVNTAANACIIYTPGTRQEYESVPDGLLNNFVTFVARSPDFLSTYALPLNEVFYIKDETAVTRKVEYIAWAAANRLDTLDAEIASNVHELFDLLTRVRIGTDPKGRRDFQTRERFIALRSEIRMNPKGWTVSKMASSVWLTRSRFCVLYKEFFGIPPADDLSDAMHDYAKDCLLHTNDSIAAISADCGYKHTESFIRAFTAHEGITPGQFRKSKR